MMARHVYLWVFVCFGINTSYIHSQSVIDDLTNVPRLDQDVLYDINLSYQSLLNLSDLVSRIKELQIGNRVIRLDVSHNNLTFISNQVFLLIPNCETIVLSYNNISHLDIDVFIGNKYLQNIDVSYNVINYLPTGLLGRKGETFSIHQFHASHNQITNMGLDLFHEGLTHLRTVDVSHNNLSVLEPWSFRAGSAYAVHFNFSHNSITKFSNQMRFYLQETPTSYTDLQYNKLTGLNIEEHRILFPAGKILSAYDIGHINFTYLNNPWICDCHSYKLVSLFSNSYFFAQADQYVICFNPPYLRNKSFGFLMRNPHVLICNITSDCPGGCLCQDHPADGHFLVDCSMVKNVTEMPHFVPNYSKIAMNMSGNRIEFLDRMYYSDNMTSLDISSNQLTHINSKMFNNNKQFKLLDFRNNYLTSLPKTIQRIPFSNVHLEHNPLKCSCESLWFGDWIRLSSKDGKPNLTCLVGDSVHFIHSVTYNSIHCYSDIVLFVCLILAPILLILLTSFIVVFKYKYETKVIIYYIFGIRPFKKRNIELNNLQNVYTYDTYISSNNENCEIRKWIGNNLLEKLEKFGFKMYYPPRDEPFGYSRADIMAEKMAESKTILVLLDKTYFNNGWSIEEFDHAHQRMSEGNGGKIIVLSYDNELQCDDIQQESLKSYISQKHFIRLVEKLCWAKIKYEISGKYVN